MAEKTVPPCLARLDKPDCMLFPNVFVTELGVTCFKCVCNKVGVEQLHSVTILTLMAVRDGEGGTSREIVSRRTFTLKMITRMR